MSKVSVIVCTRNRADSLRETLASIRRCEVPADLPAELLVVDNGSTDHTRQVVEQANLSNLPVRYVHEPRKGKGYAYNTGMAEAKGDIFLFTDDDVRVPTNWIEGMCRPIAKGEVDAVEGGVTLAPYLLRRWMTGTHRLWLAENSADCTNVQTDLVGANMCVSRSALGLGLRFDVELGPGATGFGDETLLSRQLRVAGRSRARRCDVVVMHVPSADRSTRWSFLQSAEAMGRTSAYTLYHWEHSEPGRLWRGLIRSWFCLLRYRARRLDLYPWQDIEESELWLVHDVAMYRQLLRERRRPRNYAKFGLVKVNGELPAAVFQGEVCPA